MAGAWSRGRQLLILLWKNFLLQLRRPIGTLVELLVPPAACVVVIILRFTLLHVDNRCQLTFDPDPLTLPKPQNPYHIYYSPNTSQAAREVADYLQGQESYWSVIGVASEQELVDQLTILFPPPPPITLIEGVNVSQNIGCFVGGAGIVFDNLEGEYLEYTLRLRHEVGVLDTWHTVEASFWFQAPGARVTDNSYLAEGFLHLQNRVAQAIVDWKTQQANISTPRVHVSVKQIPYPSYRIDDFLNWNSVILPLLLTMAFIYSAGMFIKELVLEKETRIREYMLMMGLQQWVLWTTWFIKQLLFLSTSTLVVTLLLKFGHVFPESNFFLLLLFFLLFATASIAGGFFMSVWFNSARLAMVALFVAWFSIYIPFFHFPQNYHVFPMSVKLALCLLTNTCMGIGLTLVSEWEVRQQGLTLDTLLQPLTIEDEFHMGWVMAMLLVDTVFFMVVAWYVNGVKPGRYGVPRPFYFPLQPSYWTGRQCSTPTTRLPGFVNVTSTDVCVEDLHEQEPQDMTIGISIQSLLKIYDDVHRCCNKTEGVERRKVAVNELSLNMYEGQITALLGHNGAGKTTTISILTGLYTPTAGTAVINGYDIRSNMDQIRQSLGICPQHNILYDGLTVMEHLKFFARLKGVSGKAVQREAECMIEELQLQDKRDAPSRNLSGGMKRKLSVGIALIGGSKTVVLDEPTSGMDPYARRATWDLLTKHKEGRTMLLTTHFMDEADLLGDRIAIMAEGTLRCSGSSLFLKSRYGVGYHMVIVKEPFCDVAKVCDLVLGKVPESQVMTDVGAELSFILPSTATHHFPALFDTLEAERDVLGVSSYGISVTTMEEVFMKVREGADETLRHRLERSSRAGTLSTLPPAHSLPLLSPLSPSSPISPHTPFTPQRATSRVDFHSMNIGISPVATLVSDHNAGAGGYPSKTYERCLSYGGVIGDYEKSDGVMGDDKNDGVVGDFQKSDTRDGVIGDDGRSDDVMDSGRSDDIMGDPGRRDVTGDVGSGYGLIGDDVKSAYSWRKHDYVMAIEGVCVGDSGDGVIGNTVTSDQDVRDEEVQLSSNFDKKALNTGLALWLQKYRAMLVKRMYMSGRFWQAMATQLVLPLMFVIYGMVLARTLLFKDDASDPKRRLSVSESSLGANQTFFWAAFDDRDVNYSSNLTSNVSSFFDFMDQSLTAESLGATDLFDYTGRVLELVSGSVQSGRDTEQCCGYHYQMLDKYCTSRTKDELEKVCNHSSSFSYRHCPRCLSCCTSHITRLPSCTHPLTQITDYEEHEFCPSSPQISLQDLVNNSTTGPLDTYTAYVDDILMRISHNITAPVFTRRVMGGFALQHRRDPPYAVCGCPDIDSVCINSFRSLQPCGGQHNGRPVYIAPLPDLLPFQNGTCPGLSLRCNSSVSDKCESREDGRGDGRSNDGKKGACESLDFQPGYEVDGMAADLLNAGVCNSSDSVNGDGDGVSGDGVTGYAVGEDSLVSSLYYQETEEMLSVTIWYNNRPWHMSAASLNAFHNVWLRQATNNSDLTLTINNHPLPRTNLTNLADAQQANLDGYYVAITVVFGYSFLVASFVLVLVAEKENKAKHLQFVNGGEVTSFWLANLTWDLLNSLLPIAASLIIIAAARVEAYSGIALLAVASLLLLTCWSSIPIVYCASFLFLNSLIAFGVILVVYFFCGLICFIVTVVISDEFTRHPSHYIFLLNPAYALGTGMNDVYINHFWRSICTFTTMAKESCAMNNIHYVDNMFSLQHPGIGIPLLYMSIEGLIAFITTLIIERQLFSKEMWKLCNRRRKMMNGRQTEMSVAMEMHSLNSQPAVLVQDSDVVREVERVKTGQAGSNSAIVINNLVKVYPKSLDGFNVRPAKLAVQGISLAIPTGECFGLLGVNGAGKTTTFNILIGDISPTSGTAIISGYDIRTDLRKVRQRIGYCPQFDALIERMTGRELLTMFARLRGIPERLISQAVEGEVVRLDLTKHARKQCGKYSGGNKRKLSTAIALIGDPPIILLDEPTTGMDPATRRYLWDVLTGITREGKSIVLTSHSMEECEALCTRLAIMVNGQFKCLGSIQHLKNKYGSGYTLEAKVRRRNAPTDVKTLPQTVSEESLKSGASSTDHGGRRGVAKATPSAYQSPPDQFNTAELHAFIMDTFPGARLLEEHQGAVTYQLCNESLRWATVFREIERHRDELGVTDYSVSQTTLEQVFVNFAKDQAEEEHAL